MTDSSNGGTHIASALMIGLIGAFTAFGSVLVAGHGIVLALLAYSLTGTVLMTLGVAAPIALRKARARIAHGMTRSHGFSRPA